MVDELKQWWSSLQQVWGKMDMNQRMLILLGSVVGIAVLAGAIWWSTRPDFDALYSQLSPQDASAVVEVIKEKKIPYRLAAGGTRIEVPSKKIYELRLDLAGKGLPHGEGVGFEIFDKMSFGVTDEVQRINYLRALQNELEKTIDALEVIESSRVHLVMPKDDLWNEEAFPPTASVMVKLGSGGALSDSQVDSIRHLLASAIRGLDPERVTIVDTRGKVLSAAGQANAAGGLTERQAAYQKKTETYLREQCESLLAEILGPGKAAVRIFAEVDFDQVLTEREYYTPVVGNKGLVRSEKQNSMTPSSEGGAGGPAGVASNLQGYPPSGVAGPIGTSKNERVLNYEMNRTVERITTATGAIKKLSVGVFVDGEMPAERLADIQSVLSRTVGIDPARGDQIEVKAVLFNREETEKERMLLEKSQRQKFWLTALTVWAPRGLLVLIALGFLAAGARNLKTVGGSLPRASETPGNGHGANGEGIKSEEILTLLKKNPTQTAEVLKQWMS